MKIQGCNTENFTMRNSSNSKTKGEFGGAIANVESKEEEVLTSAPPKVRTVLNVNMSAALRATAGNNDKFKNFVRDAMSLQAQDIKQHIEELCSDETGVNIGMEQLDELLDAYISDMK